MRPKMFYSIIEGLKGLRRAKFSAFVATSTIFFALVLIGIFGIIILNIHHIIQQIQSRMEMEVFIDNSFNPEQIYELKQKIISIQGIDSVHYVSKAAAAALFRQQFGQEIFDILDDNPLPASFQIRLHPSARSRASVERIAKQLEQLDGVDEVIYRQDLIVLLERYIRIFLIIILGIGILLGGGAIFLVSNTIKLIIYSRLTIIEIMKLVGATRQFIRRPFLVEGIVQGLLGGITAAIFFYLSIKAVKLEIPGVIFIDKYSYFAIILLGICLGFLGSVLALRKFLKY
ncbi:MAG: ABC transporter permease [candidate division KSB1 bacterium]|nr:ABC transporter permease [candidate division KSB1 bacterium]